MLFFVILLAAMALAYLLLSRQYRSIVSGGVDKHKRRLIKTLKKSLKDITVFANLPLQYGGNRSEADILVVGDKGVILLEVIICSGVITGADTDVFWHYSKNGKNGRPRKMLNPIFPLKRQSKIVRNMLLANGKDLWVENLLLFQGKDVRLDLKLKGNTRVFTNKDELLEFIVRYFNKNNR